MKRILVVEDEPEIQELLLAYLRGSGYAAEAVGDGPNAWNAFHREIFDLVLLDVLLPGMDGFSVCEQIRRESAVPIVMLTSLYGEAVHLRGFDLQIDDYVTKPFSMPVLLRKIAAVLRRTSGEEGRPALRYQGLLLDPDARECCGNGAVIELTAREFDLLWTLAGSPGRVFTREALLSRIWGYDFFGDERIVDSHIKNLRKKLPVDCVETIRGVGYRAAKEA